MSQAWSLLLLGELLLPLLLRDEPLYPALTLPPPPLRLTRSCPPRPRYSPWPTAPCTALTLPPLPRTPPPSPPQVFSLAYGTVHEEVNSLKRSAGRSKYKEGSLVETISEEGVVFKSYRCLVLSPGALARGG